MKKGNRGAKDIFCFYSSEIQKTPSILTMEDQGNEYCFTIHKKSGRFPELFPEKFLIQVYSESEYTVK